MISEQKRLIIVFGMAHSGTTIFTDILSQHPDIHLHADGTMAYIHENDLLLNADEEGISAIADEFPTQRILLKRPWVEVQHKEWLIKTMPEAYFIYCIKGKEKTIKSWSAPNAYVNDDFRNKSFQEKATIYDNCLNEAMDFKKRVKQFITVENEELIRDPQALFQRISYNLELREYPFNVDEISSTKGIKKKLIPSEESASSPSLLRRAGSFVKNLLKN